MRSANKPQRFKTLIFKSVSFFLSFFFTQNDQHEEAQILIIAPADQYSAAPGLEVKQDYRLDLKIGCS